MRTEATTFDPRSRLLRWSVIGGALASPLVIVGSLIAIGFTQAHAEADDQPATASWVIMVGLVLYLCLLGWGAWRLTVGGPSPDGRIRRASSIQVLIGTGIATLVISLVAGIIAAMTSGPDRGALESPAALPLFLAAMVFGGVSTVIYYRRLDEAALEAHKFAWLWGAQSGLFLATCAALFMLVQGRDGGSVADGIMFTVLLAFVGYGVAWGVWWFRKR